MKNEDFAFIGSRLLAIYWTVVALNLMSSLATSWAAWQADVFEFPSEAGGWFYIALVPILLYLSAVLVLWFGGARIAQSIIPPKVEGENQSSTFTLLQIQSVAFAAVGILILLTSVPEISKVLYKIYQLRAIDVHSQVSFSVKAHVLGASIQLILGISLLFGSKGLSGLLIRFRDAGSK